MIHLQNGGASLVLSPSDETFEIVHWGAALGEIKTESLLIAERAIPHGGLDVSPKNLILREHSRGWNGRPALRGHRSGVNASNYFAIKSADSAKDSATLTFADAIAGLEIAITYKLDVHGILTIESKLTNVAEGNYTVDQLINWLPIPPQADELLDFYGHWTKERQPQRRAITHGLTVREGFEGRSGHDYTITSIALNHGTTFNSGEAWSIALAWSGNNSHFVEKLIDGNSSLGAGENLLPGEIILAKGESYVAPKVIAAYSANGLDGITNAHYAHIRARASHPKKPRPLTLNLWEAVYFDHNFEKLSKIIEKAAEIGVERVVLDDGWFGARRDDKQGLGDWVISPEVWPNGLKPLSDLVNSKGMEFGLWFEGEMIQIDSDAYRAHPEWLLHEKGRMPVSGRAQQVIDLTNPAAYKHVLEQVDAVIKSANVAYIKWDHNRSLSDPISNGRPAVRTQTEAIYNLFDELKKRNPGLEIESCSSGGGRVDLGMLEHADRFWTSDQNDPLERHYIQRWTAMVVPPEMLGTHVGPTHGHQTHRTADIQFRALNALFGHAGIEWNVLEATDHELKVLKSFINFYKANRALLHSGNSFRSDTITDRAYLYGTIAQNKSEALYTYMQLQSADGYLPITAQLGGLDPKRTYKVEVVTDLAPTDFMHRVAPGWYPTTTATGAELSLIGLELPVLRPESGLLIKVTVL